MRGNDVFFILNELSQKLPKVIIKGLPAATRSIMNSVKTNFEMNRKFLTVVNQK